MHVADDMKAELQNIGISERRTREIISEILGQEHEGVRTAGLVDCADGEFDERLAQLSAAWPDQFREYMASTRLRIRSLIDTLRLCMSRSTRVAAGLGDPPNKYDNQRAESINNVLKEETGRVKVDQVVLHELVELNVVQQQLAELSKALYGMGEYRLAAPYDHLQKNPVQWKTMHRGSST